MTEHKCTFCIESDGIWFVEIHVRLCIHGSFVPHFL